VGIGSAAGEAEVAALDGADGDAACGVQLAIATRVAAELACARKRRRETRHTAGNLLHTVCGNGLAALAVAHQPGVFPQLARDHVDEADNERGVAGRERAKR
jgi:hypothetical protein